MADNFQVIDASGATQTMRSRDDGGVHIPLKGVSLPSAVIAGVGTVTGAAVTLVGASTPVTGMVCLKADVTNSEAVWVGGAAVAVDLGFPLYPGEQVLVSADDLQAIYIASDTAAVNVYYIQGG